MRARSSSATRPLPLSVGKSLLQIHHSQRTHYKHAALLQDEASSLPSLHSCNLRHGHGLHALCSFDHLLPDKSLFSKALSVCSKEKALDKGKRIHALAVFVGFDSDAVVATTVLNFYGKCGALDDAHKTFEGIPDKDVISWNAIIAACAQHGHGAKCLQLYAEMHQKCVLADEFTCVSILSACASLEDLKTGRHIHAWGPRGEVILDTALINMYCKCGSLDNARSVFDKMDRQDVISWNTMISGYAQLGYSEDVFNLSLRMWFQGMAPNRITFIGIIGSCATLCEGREVHACLVEVVSDVDIVLGSALVDMYCKCSSLHDAYKIFDSLPERNLITWNSMIAGYTTQKQEAAALKLFDTMRDEGINPDRITWSTVLDACAGLESLAEGEWLYNCVVKVGLEYDSSIAASVLKLYSNYGCFDNLHILFERISQKTFLLWNTMIMVHAQHGLIENACELFHDMHASGVIPDSQMLADLLGACAKQGTLSEGRWIHSATILLALDTDAFVSNALINMYGKCGSLEDAQFLFDRMLEKNVVTWTSMIAVYTHSGNNIDAILLYSVMQRENAPFDKVTFINLLNACSRREFLSYGLNMHQGIAIMGFDLDAIVVNALTYMYGKCGALDDAKRVFDCMASRDVVSWNTMITVYAQQSKVADALQCIVQMDTERVFPDEVTFISMLSACTSTENITEIRSVHQRILFGGFESLPTLASALMNVYCKCGTLKDAQRLFDRMVIRDVVTWNAMIMGLIEHGSMTEAHQLFIQMQTEGVLAVKASYVCTLNAYDTSTSLAGGKLLHASIISLGFSQDIIVATALVSMYGKCCSLEDACVVFHRMGEKDEVSWNSIIGAFSENESSAGALQLLERMLEEAVLPNSATYLNILHACAKCRTVMAGRRLHAVVLFGLFLEDSGIRNAVLNMYEECGHIADIERIFHELLDCDVVACNIMIKAYAHTHNPQQALQTFSRMGVEGILPDEVTFISVLEACGSLGACLQGKAVHSCIVHSGISHVYVHNALVHMYSKCNCLQEAMDIVVNISERNAATWNAIISAYCQREDGKKALQIFNTMLLEGLPDVITFASVLCACTNEEALTDGKLLHNFIASLGFEQEVVVGNSLINMYSKCGSLREAERVFERLPRKNTATWNTMIMVDTLQGDSSGKTLFLFDNMQRSGVTPNEITFASVLDFCASNGDAFRGRILHMQIVFCGFELDVTIATSLVNLYGKCGILTDAMSVFTSAINKNLFAWTAMIAAYACHGLVTEALVLLTQMRHQGLAVDRVTLVSILSACNYAGLLDSGQHVLSHMSQDNMVDLQHLDCVIDLLGRMGQLIEAENLIAIMPFQPTMVTWTALLGACRNMGAVGRASHAVAHIFELDRQNTAAFIVLSNMHLAAQSLPKGCVL